MQDLEEALLADWHGTKAALEEVRAFMRTHRLTDDDLVECDGRDLNSSNRRLRERALRVEKCWELIARLGVKAPPPKPTKGRITGLRGSGDTAGIEIGQAKTENKEKEELSN
jgi:hypothetical protein